MRGASNGVFAAWSHALSRSMIVKTQEGRTMTYGDRIGGYPPASKLLHWLVAVCVLATAPVAIAMVRVSPGPAQDALYNFHKSLGILIFVLMILRLINRIVAGAPPPEPDIERWQTACRRWCTGSCTCCCS